jgi:Protein of unknwon function (DUF3310)
MEMREMSLTETPIPIFTTNDEESRRARDFWAKSKKEQAVLDDPVDHPPHYTRHPSGVECIQITEHMNFCTGNAVKYIWRHVDKGGVEDLKKARWYLNREIQRLEGAGA